MLGTFDEDGIDVPSPDEVLATVESSAASQHAAPSTNASSERRLGVSDKPGVQDVDSDEILRELEEHHRRGQPTARPCAPRGSAELPTSARRSRTRARRRTVRAGSPTGLRPRGQRRRATLVLAALVPLTIAATAVALSHVGGPAARAPGQTHAGRRADEITAFIPLTTFGTLTSLVAAEARRLPRHQTSAVEHRPKKPRSKSKPRHRPARQAVATPVVSTPPPSTVSSSSPAPAPSTQSASGEQATAASTQHTQPAFGQNGSLGPGRGAPGTQ